MSPVIHVAVGVIRDGQGRILLSQRRPDVHQGGLWEFPGGKLEHGERVQNALWRELEEELGIVPREAHPLIRVRHVYAECTVMLDVWEVCSFTGTPVGREGQPLKWLGTDALSPQDFPAANKAIIKAVTVPERYLITPDPGDDWDGFLERFEQILRAGDFTLIQLRAPSLDEARLNALARECLALDRAADVRILVNASPSLALDVGADGVHLNGATLSMLDELPEGLMAGASTHDLAQLERAESIGVDFAVLGPVAHTGSHPDAKPLGWQCFHDLVDGFPLPVFALGGLGIKDEGRARMEGGRGVAAITGFWN